MEILNEIDTYFTIVEPRVCYSSELIDVKWYDHNGGLCRMYDRTEIIAISCWTKGDSPANSWQHGIPENVGGDIELRRSLGIGHNMESMIPFENVRSLNEGDGIRFLIGKTWVNMYAANLEHFRKEFGPFELVVEISKRNSAPNVISPQSWYLPSGHTIIKAPDSRAELITKARIIQNARIELSRIHDEHAHYDDD